MDPRSEEPKAPYGVALHAGAAESWFGDDNSLRRTKEYLEGVILKAEADLQAGAKAPEVVTSVVAALEDYPDFNAGKGSVINIDGFHELEAAIIDGINSEYRAVAGCQRTKNPVRLAHAMLSAPSPAFLFGEPTDKLAEKYELNVVENEYFTTPKRKDYWESQIHRVRSEKEDHGTVGAVVLDIYGNIAAANSTGGMTFKSSGRLGDTAVIGAGLYADKCVAIACGSGESILKAAVAGKAASQVRQGKHVGDAVRDSVLDSARHFPESSCGVIAIDSKGTISIECNSRIFAVASKSASTPLSAGIIRTTFPVLDQHICYEDDLLKAGLTKYPTAPNQITVQLKAAPTLALLDSDLLENFFLKIRAHVFALREYCGATSCGFISNGKDYCHLVPFLEHAGASYSQPVPSQYSSSSTWMGEHQLDESNDLVIESSSEDGSLRSATVKPHFVTTSHVFTMNIHAYSSFIKAIFKTLQLLIKDYGQDPEHLRIEVSPLDSRNSWATIYPTSTPPAIPPVFPKPATYHEIYPGEMTLEFGKLAPNFKELASVASLIAAKLQATLPAVLGTVDKPSRKLHEQPEELLAKLHDTFSHAAVSFLGHRQGYRFINIPPSIPDLTPVNNHTPSSVLSTTHQLLDKAFGTIKGCRGVYVIGTSHAQEGEAASTFTSVQAMIRGNLSEAMLMVEDCVEHVTETLLEPRCNAFGAHAVEFTHVHHLLQRARSRRQLPSVPDYHYDANVTDILGARWERVKHTEGDIVQLRLGKEEVAAAREYGNGTEGLQKTVVVSIVIERYFVWLLRLESI